MTFMWFSVFLRQSALTIAPIIEEVKAFLGHASVKTTERYAKFAGDALMEAAKEMMDG
jgi:hypothetical protein